MKIVEDMPATEYHASPGVSSSLLKAYAQSAAHGRAAELGQGSEQSEAMLFGEACHAYVFQPDVYRKAFVTKPTGMTFATKEGKAWRAEQKAKIISRSDEDAFDGMSKSIGNHPVAGPFIRAKGRCELSLLDTLEGEPIRARLDKLTDENVIVDLKTVQSAKPFDFVRQAFYLGWHMQAAWYMDMLTRAGLPCGGFVFIAVEKTAPYVVTAAEFDAVSIERGRADYQRLFALREKCHEEERWPGYIDQAFPYQITLPKWALEMQEPAEQQIYELA